MTELIGPRRLSDRIMSIDVLRGVAVLGILLLNVRTFALPSSAYSNPSIAGADTPLDSMAFTLVQVFGDMKFMAIFSMLFGVGIVMFCGRLESKFGASASLWYRRLLWLLLIGLCHAWLLWWGDILVAYALCGMMLYPLRNLRPNWLITGSLASLLFGSLLWWGMGALIPLGGEEVLAKVSTMWSPTGEMIAAENAAWGGSWLDQTPKRIGMAITLETWVFAMWMLWRILGLMLLGMALYRWGLFDLRRSRVPAMTCVLLGFGLGLPLVIWGQVLNARDAWQGIDVFFGNSLWNYWGSIGVALGWSGIVLLICQLGWARRAIGLLACVGRMALTNYLAQSLLCGLIFYGWGFGWYGELGYAAQLIAVAAIWAVQLGWSVWWLNRFRFGPVEWMWRSLTYWSRQPMRTGSVPSHA